MIGRALVLCSLLTCASSLQISSGTVTRRWAIGTGVAVVAAPLAPAFAKSKASMAPNKPEGVGANAQQYMSEYKKQEYAKMAGDKGSRGVASAEFEKNDTVQRNREQNLGLARDKDGRKIVQANRNRDPAELGLKQWNGN